MVDKDTENFEEEFNLAEDGEFEEHTVAQSSSQPPLFVRILVTIVLLALIGYGVYKGVLFFKQRIKNFLPHVSTILSKKSPSTVLIPESTVKTNPSESNPNFDDISQAFSKADQTSGTSQIAPTDPNAIAHMQKDLFNSSDSQAIPNNATLIAATKVHSQKLQIQEAKQSALQETLDKLNNQLEDNHQQTKRLEEAVNTLGRPLSQISREIKSLDGRIQTITDSLNTLADDLNSLKKGLVEEGFELAKVPEARLAINSAKPKSSPVSPETLTYTGPEYTIHAVVPGRVWLKTQKGQIITVTEGDSLGDYGKVLVIDAHNSTIMTSSGISFK